MKTRINNVVKTLCTAAIVVTFSTSAMANLSNEQDAPRQPAVKAQQVYKFTYNPEKFSGSLAQDIQLAQEAIMTELQVSRDADIATTLKRSAAELQGYALLASANDSDKSSWAINAITTLLPSFKARAYL